MDTKVKDSEDTTQGADGLVLYTDGGSRGPSSGPGYGGSGMHGYSYSLDSPKKGTGNTSVKLTTVGYIVNDEVKTEHQLVTPLGYIDSVTSFSGWVTNNVAELTAGIMALQKAISTKAANVYILADSMYFVDGSNKWLNTWKSNGWKKRDGSPVSNMDLWQTIMQLIDKLAENKQSLTIAHIYAHSGFLGNEMADRLATIGITRSMANIVNTLEKNYPPTKYWDKNSYTDDAGNQIRIEKHPFFGMPRFMFSTHSESLVPGRYLLSSAIRDDDLSMIGSVDPNRSLAVVYMDEPEPVIESFIEYQCKFAMDLPSIIVGRLDYLMKPTNYIDILTYGTNIFLRSSPLKMDLCDVSDQPVSRELKPARKAQWEVDEYNNLNTVLKSFQAGEKDIVVTDITPRIYDVEENEKTKETKYKLNDEFVVGLTHFNTPVAFASADGIETTDCRFTLGIDIVERNILKRLEDRRPKVSAITWCDHTPAAGVVKSFRVATIIEVTGGIGIWSGVYSNLRIVNI